MRTKVHESVRGYRIASCTAEKREETFFLLACGFHIRGMWYNKKENYYNYRGENTW
jgi:hypothetical protein